MTTSKLQIKQCKLVLIVTVLCTHNFACTNVHAEPFYMHKNQCIQILNLSSPVVGGFKWIWVLLDGCRWFWVVSVSLMLY